MKIITMEQFESRTDEGPRQTANWGGWTTVSRDPAKNFENVLSDFKGKKVHEDDFLLFANFEGESGLFVDVGANMGFSAISFRNVNSTMDVLSFEIIPILKSVLTLVRDRVPRFEFRMCGISDHSGSATIYIPTAGDLLCTPLASLNLEAFATDNRLSDWKKATGQDEFELLELPVEIATLDELALIPSIVKIDVEGAELAALHGMKRTLSTWRPIVMCEKGLDQAFIEFLATLNYRRYAYVPNKNALWEFPPGDNLPLNVIFVHESRADYVRQHGVEL